MCYSSKSSVVEDIVLEHIGDTHIAFNNHKIRMLSTLNTDHEEKNRSQ
jgi:hypothetical protein